MCGKKEQTVVREHGEGRDVVKGADAAALERAPDVADKDLHALVEEDLAPAVHGGVAEAREALGDKRDERTRRARRRTHDVRCAAAKARLQDRAELAHQARALLGLGDVRADPRAHVGGRRGREPRRIKGVAVARERRLQAARQVAVLERRRGPEAEVQRVHQQDVLHRRVLVRRVKKVVLKVLPQGPVSTFCCFWMPW